MPITEEMIEQMRVQEAKRKEEIQELVREMAQGKGGKDTVAKLLDGGRAALPDKGNEKEMMRTQVIKLLAHRHFEIAILLADKKDLLFEIPEEYRLLAAKRFLSHGRTRYQAELAARIFKHFGYMESAGRCWERFRKIKTGDEAAAVKKLCQRADALIEFAERALRGKEK